MRLPLYAASGDEVACALRRAGFHVASQTADGWVLENAYRSVAVRRASALEPDELLGILRASAVSYSELVELLDAPRYESSVRRRTIPEDGVASAARKATK